MDAIQYLFCVSIIDFGMSTTSLLYIDLILVREESRLFVYDRGGWKQRWLEGIEVPIALTNFAFDCDFFYGDF